ncbi:MAG: flagellar biosynthetic protein FliR [Gemmatimonadota bacterium]
MNAFDPTVPGAAAAFVLVLTRVSAMVAVAPIFSARVIPMSLRSALVVLLVILMQPVAAGRALQSVVTPVALASEVLIGLTLGFGIALIIGAAELAGEVLSIQIGLSGAALVDPMSLQQSTALGQFMQLFAVTLLLSTNGHIAMLDALSASFTRLPLGATIDTQAGLALLGQQGAHVFALGVQFAAPVIAVAVIANLALAVLSRAAPQFNILQLAFPLQIGLGLIALLAAVPLIAAWFGTSGSAYDAIVSRVLMNLGGAR